MNQRLTDTETASWTFTGITEANIFTPAMVHFQALSTNGGSVKITDTPMDVPAPATLGLIGIGLLGLLGLRRRRA